jgi:hypothetical protein
VYIIDTRSLFHPRIPSLAGKPYSSLLILLEFSAYFGYSTLFFFFLIKSLIISDGILDFVKM